MIAAIVVLFNPDLNHLDDFLNQLLLQVENVILVDNTPHKMKVKCDKFEDIINRDKIIYLDLADNMGIAFAHNEGIYKAIEIDAEYIVIFDQDSNIDSDFIKKLVSVDENLRNEGHQVAAVGPAYIDIKTNQIAPAITFNGLKVIRTIPDINYSYTIADYIISSGTLIKISLLDKIGVMSNELFIDYVDVEWGLRAKEKGYSCYIANNVIMKHSIGDATVKIPIFNKYINIHSDFRKYFILRNAMYLIIYSKLPINWRLVQIPKTLLYFIFLMVYIGPRLNNVRIFYLAFRDALLKKMYKGSME